jgi:hypothetical protein
VPAAPEAAPTAVASRATVPPPSAQPPARPTPAAAAPSTRAPAPPPQQTAPSRSSDDFLDELPGHESPDGRAAAQALAEGYRSGSDSSSGFGASGRFNRRPRIPRHTPAEQPAVRTLAWILSAQSAHNRRTGRYGTLDELVASGDLPLNGPRSDDGFVRREYRFTVSGAGGSFRADAHPLSPRGRPFYVDDAGFVLVADD